MTRLPTVPKVQRPSRGEREEHACGRDVPVMISRSRRNNTFKAEEVEARDDDDEVDDDRPTLLPRAHGHQRPPTHPGDVFLSETRGGPPTRLLLGPLDNNEGCMSAASSG